MKYKCAFDFTIVKPKKSQFIGKSGVIEIETTGELSKEEIDVFKEDKRFLGNIANHLNTVMKQKNVFMVKVNSIEPAQLCFINCSNFRCAA